MDAFVVDTRPEGWPPEPVPRTLIQPGHTRDLSRESIQLGANLAPLVTRMPRVQPVPPPDEDVVRANTVHYAVPQTFGAGDPDFEANLPIFGLLATAEQKVINDLIDLIGVGSIGEEQVSWTQEIASRRYIDVAIVPTKQLKQLLAMDVIAQVDAGETAYGERIEVYSFHDEAYSHITVVHDPYLIGFVIGLESGGVRLRVQTQETHLGGVCVMCVWPEVDDPDRHLVLEV